MDLVEIKKLADAFKAEDEVTLSNQVFKLKKQNVGLLGLIYFVQVNQKLSLSEARTKTLNFSFWHVEELLKIEESHQIMKSDFIEKDEFD
ncbi:hypothetical protein RFI02_18515 [Acinetobacter sichuanensis]|uniref:hypothetical protein n=1 Tax=Acinetobacter sichuanensis TaxID=2136183 RepID=UPI00280F23B1|nr:hypothetical protein [Acinetobacter sichuanensis]MDQ9023096.1 hypothetical protein [Acinetobacter sichuanensis]